MDSSPEEVFPQIRQSYIEASRRGYPAFIRTIEASTPINATPYIVALSEFDREAVSPRKRELIEALKAALDDLQTRGLRAEILLIGGSFLASSTPNDLDCIVYYTRDESSHGSLVEWQRGRQSEGLDLRLLRLDMDPIMVLKTTIFFGVLYTRGKERLPELRGLLLVDCSR